MKYARYGLGIAAVAATLVACAGDDSNPAAPNAHGAGAADAGGDDADWPWLHADAASEAAPDAGDDDPGSDVYPAAHHEQPPMVSFGGPVLSSMKLVTVTFAGSAFKAQIKAFDDAIVSGTWWPIVTKGYGIGAATSVGAYELPDTVSGKTLSDEVDIPKLLQDAVDAGTLPTPDAQTLYALYFPASATITLQGDVSCQSFGAYHNGADLRLEAGTVRTAYAIMPDCVFQGQPDTGFDTVAASHELIEAATDPHPEADYTYYNWNDPWSGSDQGGEIADMCEGRGTATEGSYDVATAWSNDAIAHGRNPCQPQPASQIYFGAAIQTETLVSDFGTGNDHESDGYVLLHPGETKVVEVDVFSEAKLANDLTLVAGQPSQSSSDPNTMDPIPGVTIALSRTTARNGHKVQMTLTAAPSVPLGDTQFGVRAIETTSDYHTWWAILHVF